MAFTILLGFLALISGSIFAFQSDRTSADAGIKTTIAVVAHGEHASVFGDLNFLRIDPANQDDGRISLWAGAGAPSATTTPPIDNLPARPDALDTDPTSTSRQGITVVVGGAAAEDFAACQLPDLDVWTGVTYDQLSPVEQAAAVESARRQMVDREAKYGTPTKTGSASALDIVSEFTFTLLEPKTLEPDEWRMAPPPAPTETSENGAVIEPDTKTQNEEVDATGHTAYLQCDVSLQQFWTEQKWGARFEIPALVTAGEPSKTATHVMTREGVYRVRELSTFGSPNTEGLKDATVRENWPGLDGRRVVTAKVSGAEPLVALDAVTLSYTSSRSSADRDTALFLAGVFFSLFATLCVSVVKQSLARREHFQAR